MLKDILNVGLGGALLLKEKIEEELNEFVEKGKLSKEDAKELLEKAKTKGEAKESEAKNKLKKILKEVIDELGLVSKDDIQKLLKDKK